MVDEEPALTVTVVAWLSPEGVALTSQPVGPWVDSPNGMSAGVSFLSVRLNEYDWSEGPWSSAKSVVMATEPAACSETRTSIGRVSVRLPDEAVTLSRVAPLGAPCGTSTLSVTSGLASAATNTLSTIDPPPRNDAFQSFGTPAILRSTRRDTVVFSLMSNVAVAPGSMRTAGNGVVMSSPGAAMTAGAAIVAGTKEASVKTEALASEIKRGLRRATDMRDLTVSDGSSRTPDLVSSSDVRRDDTESTRACIPLASAEDVRSVAGQRPHQTRTIGKPVHIALRRDRMGAADRRPAKGDRVWQALEPGGEEPGAERVPGADRVDHVDDRLRRNRQPGADPVVQRRTGAT